MVSKRIKSPWTTWSPGHKVPRDSSPHLAWPCLSKTLFSVRCDLLNINVFKCTIKLRGRDRKPWKAWRIYKNRVAGKRGHAYHSPGILTRTSSIKLPAERTRTEEERRKSEDNKIDDEGIEEQSEWTTRGVGREAHGERKITWKGAGNRKQGNKGFSRRHASELFIRVLKRPRAPLSASGGRGLKLKPWSNVTNSWFD